ncbi:MarR family winged helix-turn-helix transcriptional regulator [Nocardioides coralli]|jgi:DNA-binding MarR family transcriptional regulator|uniref:MarR family winged helix-turn-helix transcriptional regulator n=1 Tax=Nocardioides coralli TaxID=2872154 RepID=UPI001CA3B62C|nr:MarR family transcriptional regulator [Nocardioides coralli]QZY27772.1 MarR family transcriptional regulator [Nocardioides coralli]
MAPDGLSCVPPAHGPNEANHHNTLELLQGLLDTAQRAEPVLAGRAQLSPNELKALQQLARHRWGPAELARHLGVSTPAATGIVDRLVARGHATRVPHPTDRRRVQIELTPLAHASTLPLRTPMLSALAEIDMALTDTERAAVDQFLAHTIQAIKQVL